MAKVTFFNLQKTITFVVLISVIVFLGVMFFAKNPEIIVTGEDLSIKSLVYGVTMPLNKINSGGIRQLNLQSEEEYNIRRRVNGIGLPYYTVGWMRLNNGNRALVYLSDKTNVVLIPTDEYDVLYSTNNFYKIKEMLNK
jgi:uncharacterized protein YqjF (DUF2071 family)